MPMIYGKTVISTARDIHDDFSSFLTHKECYQVAYLFSALSVLLEPDRTWQTWSSWSIRLIDGFSSALDRPVFYGIPYFTTVQDYMSTMGVNIWLYDRMR